MRDLEIRSAAIWCRKLFVYGRSHANYRKLVPVRALGVLDRTRIYRSAVRCAGFSVLRAALSLPILVLGAACYDAGRCLPLHQR